MLSHLLTWKVWQTPIKSHFYYHTIIITLYSPERFGIVFQDMLETSEIFPLTGQQLLNQVLSAVKHWNMDKMFMNVKYINIYPMIEQLFLKVELVLEKLGIKHVRKLSHQIRLCSRHRYNYFCFNGILYLKEVSS